MRFDLDNLPSDVAQLQQLVSDMVEAASTREGEIDRLKMLIKQLQRMQFGKRSERLDPNQLTVSHVELLQTGQILQCARFYQFHFVVVQVELFQATQ